MCFVLLEIITKDTQAKIDFTIIVKFLEYRHLLTQKFELPCDTSKNANGQANSEDPDQIAPLGAAIGVCTVCHKLSAQKFRIN